MTRLSATVPSKYHNPKPTNKISEIIITNTFQTLSKEMKNPEENKYLKIMIIKECI